LDRKALSTPCLLKAKVVSSLALGRAIMSLLTP
jgi:hypothetical protein